VRHCVLTSDVLSRNVSSVPETTNINRITGSAVGNLRRAVGLTQAELANAMQQAGFGWSRTTVAEVETAVRALSIEELLGVASYFEVPTWFILLGVGAPIDSVRLGNAELPVKDWAHFVMDSRTHAYDVVHPDTRSVIDRIWRGVRRPWATIWRKEGNAGSGYMEARRRALSRRSRFPGPTYVFTGEGNLAPSSTIAPWGMNVKFELLPGEPYVARDDIEAALLEELATTRDDVERIPAYKAYRMRRKA